MIKRLGISLEEGLLARFDALIEARGYANRSEAIRDLIRAALVEEEWKHLEGPEQVLVVTLVYDHESYHLAQKLTDIQHARFGMVVATLHIHLDEHNCLETLVLRGDGKEIMEMAQSLVAARGVKFGRVVPATTGRELP